MADAEKYEKIPATLEVLQRYHTVLSELFRQIAEIASMAEAGDIVMRVVLDEFFDANGDPSAETQRTPLMPEFQAWREQEYAKYLERKRVA